MEYRIINLDDYDKSLKIEQKKILCFSKKSYKSLDEDTVVVGEVHKYKDVSDEEKKEKEEKEESFLVLGDKKYPVCEPGKTNRIRYAIRGYVAVGENEYLALYRSRLLFLFWLLGILAIGGLIIAMILHFGISNPKPKIEPTYNPLPPVDSNAQTVAQETKKTQKDSGKGGSVNMTLHSTATLSLSSKKIDIDFLNPGESSHDVVIELDVVSNENGKTQEIPIAKSGRIPVGSKLTSLSLSVDPSLFEGEGTYNAKYYIMCYDPKTGVKANVDPVFDKITLIVKK